eukprot:2855056-Amphidinium_carterae.1
MKTFFDAIVFCLLLGTHEAKSKPRCAHLRPSDVVVVQRLPGKCNFRPCSRAVRLIAKHDRMVRARKARHDSEKDMSKLSEKGYIFPCFALEMPFHFNPSLTVGIMPALAAWKEASATIRNFTTYVIQEHKQ